MRGAHINDSHSFVRVGIIPACAGSTEVVKKHHLDFWDHPRMCGEHMATMHCAAQLLGSSPHVRGALYGQHEYVRQTGIIPACAGSTKWVADRPDAGEGSSPHVRGAHQDDHWLKRLRGIIPACAGSTTSDVAALVRPRDHPRMCGEHARRR